MPPSGTVLDTATSLVWGAGAMAAFRAASMRARMSARFCEIIMSANLARRQATLNADMPLVLMTDDRRCDWAQAARALPRGSVVVVRARDAQQRLALAKALHGIAPLLIEDDPALAARIGAAGLHLPEARMKEAAHWRAAFSCGTASAGSAHEGSGALAGGIFALDHHLVGPFAAGVDGRASAGCGVPVAGFRLRQPQTGASADAA